jgi:cobalt-zinc-cadmium efflux system membrane fusion protein
LTLKREGPVTFETAPARRGPPLPAPPVTARVAAVESLTAPVFAPVDSRVATALVRLGDRVTKGQKLVELRSAELPVMQRELEAAQAAVRTKEEEVARLMQLVEARTGSQHDLMVAQGELERLRIDVRASAARVRSLGIRAEGEAAFFAIAPRNGTIIQLSASPGLLVGPARTDPLATVANLDEVLVVGDVASREVAGVHAGQRAEVRLGEGNDDVVEGTVEFVSDVVDPERQTVPVRVRVANTERKLRPNAFVELMFHAEDGASVIEVPSQAVVSDGARSVVFVERQKGHYEKVPVEIGRRTADMAEIRKGLEEGTPVVTSHALLLLNALDAEG